MVFFSVRLYMNCFTGKQDHTKTAKLVPMNITNSAKKVKVQEPHLLLSWIYVKKFRIWTFGNCVPKLCFESKIKCTNKSMLHAALVHIARVTVKFTNSNKWKMNFQLKYILDRTAIYSTTDENCSNAEAADDHVRQSNRGRSCKRTWMKQFLYGNTWDETQ